MKDICFKHLCDDLMLTAQNSAYTLMERRPFKSRMSIIISAKKFSTLVLFPVLFYFKNITVPPRCF